MMLLNQEQPHQPLEYSAHYLCINCDLFGPTTVKTDLGFI
jgi:hypothetical protein